MEGESPDTEIQGKFGKFAESFSAHGFNKVYGSRNWIRRILWLVVVILMVGFGTYQCYRVIAEYLTYPKKVSISMAEDPVAEFPAVTVCNLNPLANRDSLIGHPTWDAFVTLEQQNMEPICEGLIEEEYSGDYYDYEEMHNYYEPEATDDEEMYYSGWQPAVAEDGSINWGYSGDGSEPTTLTPTSHETAPLRTEEGGAHTLTTGEATTGDEAETSSAATEQIETASTSSEPSTSDSTTAASTTMSTTSDDSTTTTDIMKDGSTTTATLNSSTIEDTDLTMSTTMAITTDGSVSTSSLSYESTSTSLSSDETGSTSTPSDINQSTTSASSVETATASTTIGTNNPSTASTDPDGSTTMTQEQTSTNVPKRKREAPSYYSEVKDFPDVQKRILTQKQTMMNQIKEEFETPENERLVFPDGQRTLPKSKSTRDRILDFSTFSKLNWNKFTENHRPPTRYRPKREAADTLTAADTNKEEPKRLTKKDVIEYRKKCSIYYTYLTYLKEEESITSGESMRFSNDEKEDCPKKDYKESITYNPLCRLEIFCDNFGCFDYHLRDYKEKLKYNQDFKEMERCPSCGYGQCWPTSFFSSWQNGKMGVKQIEEIFGKSRTPDFSDIMGIFTPTMEDIEKYSIPAKDFIQTCSFDRRPCSHRQFITWTSDKYGQCYTFNSAFRNVTLKNNKTVEAIPRKSSSVGPRNGIRLTMNIQASQYLSLLSPDVGIRVIVHSPRQIPFPEEMGFNISPGLSVSVAIRRKKLERVGAPYGNCRNDSNSESFKEYSAVTCKKLCLEKTYWDQCHCYVGQNPVFASFEDRPQNKCSPFNVNDKLCMESVMFFYQQGYLDCKCPPPCNEIQYDSQVTSSEENKQFYTIVQNLRKTVSGNDLCSGSENETVRIHLYLESLNYETIKESPAYTWDTLVCNVGGNLGLFIGMSLVTLAELLEFLLDVFFVWGCTKDKKTSKVVKVEPKSGLTDSATQTPQSSRRALDHSIGNPRPQRRDEERGDGAIQASRRDPEHWNGALDHEGAGKAFDEMFLNL